MFSHLRLLLVCGVVGLLLPTPAFPQAGDKKPAPKDEAMASLARFVGEWQVDGKWSTGETLKARGVYQWGLDKKLLIAKTFVMDKDKEYQRYESIFAWHPGRKSLYEITFSFDGSISEVMIETKEKDTLHVGYTPFHADKPMPVRQTLRFTDDDHFVWVVQMQKGQEWVQLIKATWVRKK